MIVSLRRGSPTQLTSAASAPPVVARAPGRPDHLLAFVAEVSLGAQLVVRHRAPRLAAAVAALVALVVAAADAWSPPGVQGAASRLALASALANSLAAVAGVRLLAPGAALHAARYAATSAGTAVLGRLTGAMAVLTAPTLTLILVLGRHAPTHVGTSLMVALAAVLAVIALAMATAPHAGAFAAGLVWSAAALVGAAPPDALLRIGGWRGSPVTQGAIMLWQLLPLPWRVAASGSADLLGLVAVAAGAALVARAAIAHVGASRRVVR